MAKAQGVSPATVQRVWAARGSEAPSGEDVQAVERQAFRGEARRRGRPVLGPAGQGRGVVYGRKVSDTGPRPHPAEPAHEEGPCRHDDARLQTQRHDDAVRGVERAHRCGHRRVPAATPPRGVLEVPPQDRPRSPQGSRGPHDLRQLRHPQAPRRPGVAGQAPALPSALHAHLELVAQPRRAFGSGR